MSAKHIDEQRREDKKKKQKENRKEKLQENKEQETVLVTEKEPETKKESIVQSQPKNNDELIKKLRLTIQSLMIKYVAVTKAIQAWRQIMAEMGGQLSYESRKDADLLAIPPSELDITFVEKQINALGPEKKLNLQISQSGAGQPDNQQPMG